MSGTIPPLPKYAFMARCSVKAQRQLYLLPLLYYNNNNNNNNNNNSWCMLGMSLVTTAWRVFRLRMKMTASRYGGQLRIYWISSRWQPTRGGPPPWWLGVGLRIPHHKKVICDELSGAGNFFSSPPRPNRLWGLPREGDTTPSSSERRNAWNCTSSPPIPLHGAVVKWSGGYVFI